MKPYYDEDGITLYRGDCAEILPHIRNVDLVVTSPPYNTLGSRIPDQATGMHSNSGWINRVNNHGYADDMPEPEYQQWLIDHAAILAESCRPGASMFYNHKIRYRDTNLVHPLDIVRQFPNWTLRQEIIWARPGSHVRNARMFPPSDERIYWLYRNGAKWEWNREHGNNHDTVWKINPPHNPDAPHSCPFPETIPGRAILATTQPGDTVLDPYAGTGTTLHIAKRYNRQAIGIEIDPEYCNHIVERLAQQVLPI